MIYHVEKQAIQDMAAEPEKTKMLRLAEEAQEQLRRERLIFQENEMTKK